MKLAKYLRTNDITRKAFAELLGVHIGTIHRVCSPRHPRCGAELARQIVEATEGAVTLEDLLMPHGIEGPRAGEREQLSTQA